MKWQKAVDLINIEKFKIPAGWDSKEKIAEELQCSPDRVHDLLKPGLASGAFESQEFPVWDAKRRLTVRVKCYRQKSGNEPVQKPAAQGTLKQRIEQKILDYPNLTNYAISRKFNNVSAAQVAAVRAKL